MEQLSNELESENSFNLVAKISVDEQDREERNYYSIVRSFQQWLTRLLNMNSSKLSRMAYQTLNPTMKKSLETIKI